MLIYATAIWLLAGAITEWRWLQFGCFLVATVLMIELNNIYVLIRIYSRLVSCSFMLLSCSACFLFPSLQSFAVQIGIIGSWLLLFNSYQNKTAVGWVFYAFICIGLTSLVFPPILFIVPLTWFLMVINLQSLSWQTFVASLLGVTLPYWFLLCWFILHNDFSWIASHLCKLSDFCQPFDLSDFTISQRLVFATLGILAITGTVHCFRQKSGDKIRIRQLFGFFSWMSFFSALFIMLQPQHINNLLPIMIASVSPLTGHFFALTKTKITNVAFLVTVTGILFITFYNLWLTSSPY